MRITILIPAYNPDEKLLFLVKSLVDIGYNDIIIVNDGSDRQSDNIFKELVNSYKCTVLNHAVNMGKGRALKTGLNYCYDKYEKMVGVVTADADGQHAAADIQKIAQKLQKHPDSLIIGVRKLIRKMPLRSFLGNLITRWVFFLIIGKKISDVQSGLRGLPRQFIPQLLLMSGERYEYELDMLIATKIYRLNIIEEKISTIYIESNKSSHFDPLFDSMRIYFLLLRFSFSSLLASILDILVFSLSYALTKNILLSIIIGRFLIGTFVNYTFNYLYVFHKKEQFVKVLLKYYLFTLIMGWISASLIGFIAARYGFKIIIAKILIESILFVFSFSIQRDYIFAVNSAPETRQE